MEDAATCSLGKATQATPVYLGTGQATITQVCTWHPCQPQVSGETSTPLPVLILPPHPRFPVERSWGCWGGGGGGGGLGEVDDYY